MPMRCSDVVDRKRKFCKHTRVKLIGWKLKLEDEAAVATTTQSEFVLSGAPLVLFVEVK